ncbi:MAG: tail fiber domain-containing protein [Gemmatimonadota bacterium]|nr:MAG: tail fiber domain-containing protein [Gemmatimonadota bacterium]
MSRRMVVLSAIAILVLLAAGAASADVPQLINFQGKLYDSDGNTLTGQYEVTFRIYDAEEDGTLLWTETIHVDCHEGLYNVNLGLINPIDLDFDGDYWLGMQVAGDDELSPRYRLVSVPTAFRAAVADSAYRVSWNNMADVPEGFADGTDDTAASGGDGHSLDAVDGDPTDAVYVNHNGNVGIGTTSPDRNLDIRHSNTGGGIEIDRSNTAIWSGIVYKNNGSENWFVGVQKDSDNLIFRSSGTINYMVIENGTGDVGIGTDDPGSRKLKIKTNEYTDMSLVSGDSFSSRIYFGNFTNDCRASIEYSNFYDKIGFGIGGAAQRVVIDSGGRVGIGYSNPSYKLDVNGTIRGDNVSPSDVRLKKEVRSIENALKKVSSLRGVNFK